MGQRIAIVGAGQSGLQMALGLQANGYRVTLLSNRTPDQIRAGKVMSSQCMFDRALQTERELGLTWWEDNCPPVEGIGLAIPHPEQPGAKVIDWAARLAPPHFDGATLGLRLRPWQWRQHRRLTRRR